MKILLIFVLMIILYCFIKKAYKNTKDIVINKLKINAQLSNQHHPKLNILQLSDLHLENISISPNELYEKLKDEPIDLIALTGDFLDRKRTIPKLIPYLKTLNQLQPKYGIYAVLGNHDYVLRPKNLKVLIETLEKYNCKVLQNETDIISVQGTRVNIIGIDDFSTKRSNIEAAYEGITFGTNLVLTHDPNIVLNMKKYHFDYLLAGHFHGGQICYPKAYHLVKMGKLARMNIIKGFHTQDGKPFYISEGLGQTGVNIRVGSRPEMTLHELTLEIANREAVKVI
ncbi:metallophosphoesterase [Peribacillus asahii]|uniref:Metallophosphoesterase n=1 Tax=Peribacillus asahii TaxID=228899 RepID=A0A3Q9RNX7_9BACI|nr:metallophosphoesterase [Peribacillus asahii]AZV43487.1 metallophosphoesterase [Peribacillus asahii]USK83467.1 metallophosphoesterase [Peribacillus asahii]